jgi:hypothetical protein
MYRAPVEDMAFLIDDVLDLGGVALADWSALRTSASAPT